MGWATGLETTLGAPELLALFGHFLMLSLLAVGGAISTAPDMQRYLVADHRWLTDAQFTASVAIAQAAPGPNVLFVAVLGWNTAGAAGALATTVGCLLPSTLLSLAATRWGSSRRDTRGVRAFTAGLAPMTLGLVLSTGVLLAAPAAGHPGALALVALTVLIAVRSRISPIWLVAAGMAAGALGWV